VKHLLIVWHSRTGAARQMADAAAQAARAEPGVDVRLVRAQDADAAAVLDADGYLFAAPENLASLSGEMKEFFDRIYYGVLELTNGRPYALFVSAGSDGSNAVRQVQRICTGLRLREVAPPLIVNLAAQTPERILAPKIVPPAQLARCAETGAALAAGLASGVF
jgi:NAD(P)H-dependent FMN reductase